MARRNTALALGDGFAESLAAWQPQLDDLQSEVRAVCTDNRLHPWEWLQTPDGRLLKADALDHHAAHDLIGCQDVTWDIAGAAVEFALSDEEKDELCRIVARAVGRPVHRRLLALSERCYAAFQIGYWSLAADALAAFPAEASRTRAAAAAYARTLQRFLHWMSLIASLVGYDESGIPGRTPRGGILTQRRPRVLPRLRLAGRGCAAARITPARGWRRPP